MIRYGFIPGPFILAQFGGLGKGRQFFQRRIRVGAGIFHQFERDIVACRHAVEFLNSVAEAHIGPGCVD